MTKSEKMWLGAIIGFMASVIFYLGYSTGKNVRLAINYPTAVQECLIIKNAYIVVDNEYGMRCFKPSEVIQIK